MSLVGSELNLVLDFDTIGPSEEGNDQVTEQQQQQQQQQQDGRTNAPAKDHDDDDEDVHRAPTPQSGVEQFFLGGLPTDTISATALAEEISHRHKSLIASAEYRTAQTNLSDYYDSPGSHPSSPVRNSDAFKEVTPNNNHNNIQQEVTMSSTSTRPLPPPPPPSAEEDPVLQVDPAEKIYDTAKNIWGWGKGVMVVAPFLGLAESIATKVVETAGSSLEGVDRGVTGKLHELDQGILNPAIQVVVHTVMGAATQTRDLVQPIVLTLLKPLDFMIQYNHRPETHYHDVEPAPDAVPNQ